MTILKAVAVALGIFLGISIALMVVASLLAPGYVARHRIAGWQTDVRPAPPIPEKVPVKARAVTVPTHGGEAKGLLTLPARGPAAAGIVVAHGSGVRGRESYPDLARAMAERDVAVLVVDKDGEGYSPFRRDFERLADDVAAQVAWLAENESVRGPVGILGYSEGGWVAPIAADRHPEDIDFLTLVSAPIVTPLEQTTTLAGGLLPSPLQRFASTFLASGRAFFDYLDTDVRHELSRIDVPIFAVFGRNDPSIPIADAVDRLRGSANREPTVVVLSDAGHRMEMGSWVSIAAAWMQTDRSYLGIRGEPDDENYTAPRPPDRVWFTEPGVQLPVAVGLTAAAVMLIRRRRGAAHASRIEGAT